MQQLRGCSYWWLIAKEDMEQIIELLVLKQFIAQLMTGMVTQVQCNQLFYLQSINWQQFMVQTSLGLPALSFLPFLSLVFFLTLSIFSGTKRL